MSRDITITRRFEFDAGHRILGHESKCRYLHGHRYVVDLTVQADELDSLGRVIDFGQVKDWVGEWIDRDLDHNMILHRDDPLLKLKEPTYEIIGRVPYVIDCNPTAENIARLIGETCVGILGKNYYVVGVRIWETPNCWADWTNAKPTEAAPEG